jgi:hypothetical protein
MTNLFSLKSHHYPHSNLITIRTQATLLLAYKPCYYSHINTIRIQTTSLSAYKPNHYLHKNHVTIAIQTTSLSAYKLRHYPHTNHVIFRIQTTSLSIYKPRHYPHTNHVIILIQITVLVFCKWLIVKTEGNKAVPMRNYETTLKLAEGSFIYRLKKKHPLQVIILQTNIQGRKIVHQFCN